MKSTKTFNNISDKLKKEIPKLKPGEMVIFRMLNGVPNPEPDDKERSKDPVLYPKVQLMTQFRIFDRYQKDSEGNEVGGYVDIVCADSWLGDNPSKTRSFVCGAGMYSRFQGKFELRGGNIQDEELFEVLWLSPQRKGSPSGDSSVEVLFEILDAKADVKASVTKYDILKKALTLADEVQKNESKARSIMAALGQPVYQDKEVLMAKIGEIARTKPDDFIKTYESKLTDIIGIIQNALDAKVIYHDIVSGDVKMGNVVVANLKMDNHDGFNEQFAHWIDTAENGQDVLANIKNRVAKQQTVK